MFGTVSRFARASDGSTVAVAHLDEPISLRGVSGTDVALRLRHRCAWWGTKGVVHVELIPSSAPSVASGVPPGTWLESHARYSLAGGTRRCVQADRRGDT